MVRNNNGNSSQEKDTNIQVVVRCREVSPRTLKNSSTSVIVPPVFGQDVKINGAPAVARSYHFDGVFGPKATQENVYDKVVSPILNEVMQGYNCTLFAYGQTGTGKTYTMEGDLENNAPSTSIAPTPTRLASGQDLLNTTRLSPQAGMIPRTLYNLFYALDKQSAEYYVHVSYVELYNEELRDLLAGTEINGHDDATGFVPSGNLRIYESGTDKGVVIQGLEEKLVRNARDAVSLMQAGAMRRKVAATRCNDTSSRSHAIFTITVFIRERAVTVDGEDISKLGKLNLVDLAGSENIGRSGAQNMRAREAGSINKSLLVLGRVINALVEKNTYVPYRDSKLTHIIKDSLGGRTRTCMIATISNTVDNIEETIKTLQYASQAKGIRNRPVANQMVSKSEIVHDLQQHIERLSRDLEAARDTTGAAGFYVSRDTYEELTTQAKASRELADEWKQRVALWEEHVQRTDEQLQELTNEHMATQRELSSKLAELQAAQKQLEQLQEDLQRQQLLTRAHAHHEEALNTAALVLQASLKTSSQDVSALHAKIGRMADREHRNVQSAEQISTLVESETEKAQTAVSQYNSHACEQTQRLLHLLQSRVGTAFEAQLAETLQKQQNSLKAESKAALESAARDREQAEASGVQAIEHLNAVTSKLHANAQDAAQSSEQTSRQLAEHISKQTTQQRALLHKLAETIQTVMESCAQSTAELLSQSQTQASQTIDALRADADRLKAQHAEEIQALQQQARGLREQAQTEDQELFSAIQKMIDRRREREDAAFADVVKAATEHAMSQAAATKRLVAQSDALRSLMDQSASSTQKQVAQTRSHVETQISETQDTYAQMANKLVSTATDATSQLQSYMSSVVDACAETQKETAESASQVQQTIGGICQVTASSMEHMAQLAASSAQSMQTTALDAAEVWQAARNELHTLSQTQATERDGFASELNRGISSIATVVAQETASIRPTEPVGGTPQAKQRYRTVDSWNITRPHNYILEQAADPELLTQEAVEWTGMPYTEAAGVAGSNVDEEDEQMAMSPSSFKTASFSSPVRPDSSLLLMRKRPSENAVSPASDPASERPTRRPRTRQTEHANGSELDNSVASAIPAPTTSRLPVPTRRSRRTRT
ncbi:hypothetical protein IWW42_000698 [Coemansia sp. RSA 1085]|nr:hypothetical protein IWW42_000698 [Coemansia sp. RSA 1085]